MRIEWGVGCFFMGVGIFLVEEEGGMFFGVGVLEVVKEDGSGDYSCCVVVCCGVECFSGVVSDGCGVEPCGELCCDC